MDDYYYIGTNSFGAKEDHIARISFLMAPNLPPPKFLNVLSGKVLSGLSFTKLTAAMLKLSKS